MMKKMMTVLIAVAFTCSTLLFMASCAKKQIGAQGAGGPGDGYNPQITYPKDQKPAGAGGPGTGPGKAGQAVGSADRQLRDAINVITSGNIYFDYDRSELKADAKAVLKKKAEYLRKYPQLSIRIEGHCDERGTNEYNLALGERRANVAFKYLNAMGITGDRLTTVSYGEERPADSGNNERAWSKNRRDEFKVMK